MEERRIMSSAQKVKLFALAVVLIAMCPGLALAGNDVVVDGEGKTFYSDAVIDNLTVKNGAVVWLQRATVKGNLIVEGTDSYVGSWYGCTINGNAIVKDGGRLSMWNSTIKGNLQGDGYWYINWYRNPDWAGTHSEIGGSIQLTGGGSFNGGQTQDWSECTVGGDIKYEKGEGGVRLWKFTVGGNVQVLESDDAYESVYSKHDLNIRQCKIDGDLQVCKNDYGKVGQLGITITGNTVGGNLEVTENEPTPTVEDNDVEGDVDVD
jgi:hypothetical protein